MYRDVLMDNQRASPSGKRDDRDLASPVTGSSQRPRVDPARGYHRARAMQPRRVSEHRRVLPRREKLAKRRRPAERRRVVNKQRYARSLARKSVEEKERERRDENGERKRQRVPRSIINYLELNRWPPRAVRRRRIRAAVDLGENSPLFTIAYARNLLRRRA